MDSKINPVPEEFRTITPQLVANDAGKLIDFYKQAFGAHELVRNRTPDGTRIIHCEMLLGDSRFLVHDEFPERGLLSAKKLGGSPVTLHLYVSDVDAFFDRAVGAGAKVLMPIADHFWGDRYGQLEDPSGHRWSVASRIVDPSPKELQQRAKDYFKEHGDEAVR